MNRKDRGLLIGTLLGDSSIVLNNPSGRNKKTYHVFQFSHTDKQKEYAFYKAHKVCKMFKRTVRDPNNYQTTTNFGDISYYKFSLSHKYLKFLWRLSYPQGKKYFSKRLLSYLTPEGIALWYMDDGYVSKRKNKEGTDYVSEMRLATFCSLEEVENITSYFLDTWGIIIKRRFHKKSSSYYLALAPSECVKLESLIGKYILPSMKYKLPSYYIPRVLVPSLEGEDIV